MSDANYMAQALALAECGRGHTSPNPMVGAVVVGDDGTVVGAGFHKRAGEPHAEIYALRAAGAQARGATLYCTLEPCCHHGRTGPCAKAIAAAGIARVVTAVEDPTPLVRGGGVRYLREHGVSVTVGVAAEAATRLNQTYFTFIRRGRPHVTAKIALSLDACVAAAPGVRTQLTGAGAIRQAHLLRAEVDAIGIGSESILVDDPLLTVRDVYRERPLTRVIFDRRLRTLPTARVLSTLDVGPVIIMTSEAAVRTGTARARALSDAGATLDVMDEPSIVCALRQLAVRQLTSLLIEGGPKLHGAAVVAGVVDRVQVFIAPTWIGGGGVPWLDSTRLSIAALQGTTAGLAGDDVVIDGYVHRVD